jgi:hypothetical protein
MVVTPTGFTIAEYCEQMRNGRIVINRNYQRSPKVWPPAARSYLIDTILCGFSIPKLSLYQITDLKTRQTIKEIVDGQQRSQAILDFSDDKLRLTSNSAFRGAVYSQLDEIQQQKFVSYQLSVDLFTSAVESEIRELFRRINSYNVPLNPQEKRHSVWQGAFKWFIVECSNQYAQALKEIGVFNESQLARMEDSRLLSDLCFAMLHGIASASENNLEKMYRENDPAFPAAEACAKNLRFAMDTILSWKQLHQGALMKKYNFFTLTLAIIHAHNPLAPLQPIYQVDNPQATFQTDVVLSNLSALANAQEEDATGGSFGAFVDAAAKTTDRKKPREERFRWMCAALQPTLLA